MNNCKSRREFSDSHRGNGHTVTFEYDNLGRTKKVIYSGGSTLTYAYTGVLMVGYSYSAYGVVSAYAPLASVAAEPLTMNPLTYRGYVYDRESGLYYLQSRYYDPEIGRFLNADAFASTGQGVLGNNMFAYCLNNPTNMADSSGWCSYFWFIKIDCLMASCPDSICYNPYAPRVVVLYDGRDSGDILGLDPGDNGFQHQGQELARRLSHSNNVEAYAFMTMDDFVNCWNGLNKRYDAIYILGHGQAGKFNAAGGSLSARYTEYSYADLDKVEVSEIYLYICNGDSWENGIVSTAYSFANHTNATVYAVRDGKLSFTWYGCYPYMPLEYLGWWTATSPK